MSMQNQLGNANRALAIQDLLRRIHRINVMLWGRDYLSAETEMLDLEAQYESLLIAGKQAEQTLRDATKAVEKQGFSKTVGQRHTGTVLKKYQLEYIVNVETTREAIRQSSNIFNPNDFALAPIQRTIDQLQRQIGEAKKLIDSTPTSEKTHTRTSSTDSGYYISIVQLDSTRVEYRAYRLLYDGLTSPDGNTYISGLRQSFGVEPVPTDPDNPDNVLPVQVRLFIAGALLEITIYDIERFAVEITFSQGIQHTTIFQQVYDVILGVDTMT